MAWCNGSTLTRLFQGLHITRAAVAERERPAVGQKAKSPQGAGFGKFWRQLCRRREYYDITPARASFLSSMLRASMSKTERSPSSLGR